MSFSPFNSVDYCQYYVTIINSADTRVANSLHNGFVIAFKRFLKASHNHERIPFVESSVRGAEFYCLIVILDGIFKFMQYHFCICTVKIEWWFFQSCFFNESASALL